MKTAELKKFHVNETKPYLMMLLCHHKQWIADWICLKPAFIWNKIGLFLIGNSDD